MASLVLPSALSPTEEPMPYTPDSPLIPSATPVDAERVAAAWVRYCVRTPNYSPADLRLIGSFYATVCGTVGLDVWLVLGQVAHESGKLTSWWSARPRRNPAGIGVNGVRVPGLPRRAPAGPWAWNGYLWARGYSFARWAPDAVETHCGLLLRYAVTPGAETQAQAALINRAIAKAPRRVWGVAPTLRGLGGTWAWPGVGYAAKVATHANALREAR